MLYFQTGNMVWGRMLCDVIFEGVSFVTPHDEEDGIKNRTKKHYVIYGQPLRQTFTHYLSLSIN